jgi:MFS family permease
MNSSVVEGRIWPLVTILCIAQILSMMSFANFVGLIPHFITAWTLTNTEAGWIGGIYFAGYMVAAPFFGGLTDKYDPRRVYAIAAIIGGIASLCFALMAEGFWSALAFRMLAGMGLAGTHMPGLKILTDRIQGSRQSRAVAFYTSCFGFGSAASFLITGEIAAGFGWSWVFAASAVTALAAVLVVTLGVRGARPQQPSPAPSTSSLGILSVLKNRRAMGFILAYGFHAWEALGHRAWLVAFLIFSQTLQPNGTPVLLSATAIAALVSVASVPASIIGNELALRFGRVRVAATIGLTSAVMGCVIGFSASLAPVVVIAVFLIYNIANYADSSTITAGSVGAALPGRMGATMAMHSFMGFAGGFIGPLLFGIMLDNTGGAGDPTAWGLAFLTIGIAAALGPLTLIMLSRGSMPNDPTTISNRKNKP